METHAHTEIVQAPIEVCFATLVDFDRYPDWFSLISTAVVEEEDARAGLWTVRFELDAILKTISYTLGYRSERPGLLEWKMVRGDVKDVRGHYRLTELEPGLTEATCTQSIDVGLWVPGPIRRFFEETALAKSVGELKAAAEANS